jgi:hypothetical protein
MKKNTNVKNINKKMTPKRKKCNNTKEKITSSFDLSNLNENFKLKTSNPNIGIRIGFFQKKIPVPVL